MVGTGTVVGPPGGTTAERGTWPAESLATRVDDPTTRPATARAAAARAARRRAHGPGLSGRLGCSGIGPPGRGGPVPAPHPPPVPQAQGQRHGRHQQHQRPQQGCGMEPEEVAGLVEGGQGPAWPPPSRRCGWPRPVPRPARPGWRAARWATAALPVAVLEMTVLPVAPTGVAEPLPSTMPLPALPTAWLAWSRLSRQPRASRKPWPPLPVAVLPSSTGARQPLWASNPWPSLARNWFRVQLMSGAWSL